VPLLRSACKARRVEDNQDPLVGEIQREGRERRVLVIAAAIGIIAGVVLGMAFMLGALGEAQHTGSRGFLSHGALVFFVGPPLLSMAVGYAIFALRKRRRSS
jgi:hypothetical protein